MKYKLHWIDNIQAEDDRIIAVKNKFGFVENIVYISAINDNHAMIKAKDFIDGLSYLVENYVVSDSKGKTVIIK